MFKVESFGEDSLQSPLFQATSQNWRCHRASGAMHKFEWQPFKGMVRSNLASDTDYAVSRAAAIPSAQLELAERC